MTLLRKTTRPLSLSTAFEEIIPSVAAGVVLSALEITIATALAVLIFGAALPGRVPDGIGMLVFGAAVINGVGALTASHHRIITAIQDAPATVLSLVAAAIAGALPGAEDAAFATLVAALAAACFLTGISFLLLGYFKLGNLIRFIPYPVIGGFIGATGLLLLRGSISVMAGVSASLRHLGALFESDALAHWLPGAIFGVLLLVILQRRSHFLILPGMLVALVALFYGALALSGTSVDQAMRSGWLLERLPEGRLWQPWLFSTFDQIDWSVLIRQSGSLAAVVMISAISLLLNESGIELITGETVDFNRELKGVGLASLLAGLGGSSIGYPAPSMTMLAHKMKVRNRLPSLIIAAVCLVILVSGGPLLSYFPRIVLGGLLALLGLDMLLPWVVQSWFRLPHVDYAIVILIIVVINGIGFLEGIGLGVVLSLVFFVVNYGRIDVVKHVLTGKTYNSSVVRPPSLQQLLQAQGDAICILKLQGFIFFGTANRLFDLVSARVQDRDLPAVRYIAFDFRLVSGVDSSAALSFRKLRQVAEAQQIVLLFAHLAPEVHRLLHNDVFAGESDPLCRVFPDLDHGVEWCENQILAAQDGPALGSLPLQSLMQQLEAVLPQPAGLDRLKTYLQREDVAAETVLLRQGDAPKGLYFIEQGSVRVEVRLPLGGTVRLHRMDAGTIVGEVGTYLGVPATASVIALQPSVLYLLTPDALERMNEGDPALAAEFHRFMVRLLAERLLHATATWQALVD